jgi:hypothetical protein
MRNDDYKTTRIWAETIKVLRMLHALTGESIVSILDRLAKQELERVLKEQNDRPESL